MSAKILQLFRLLALVALALLPAAAWAVPNQASVQALFTSSGGPAADGNYAVTLRLYEDQYAVSAFWTEGPVSVSVKGGLFTWNMGSKVPLTPEVLAGKSPWLAVAVGQDPETDRVPLQSVPFALRAAVAEGVSCVGCITMQNLNTTASGGLVKTSDLAGFAQKTDLGDYVKAASLAKVAQTGGFKDLLDAPKLADVASSGLFSDLIGTPVLPKAGSTCGTGLVVKGIKQDGSLECVTAGDSAIAKLFSTVITQPFVAKPEVPILDASPQGVYGIATVPSLGAVDAVEIDVDVENSNVANVRLELLDPAGNLLTLYDGGATGTSLKTTFPTLTPVAKGTLDTWKGKDPQGSWSVIAYDKQKTNGGTDGVLHAFTVRVTYSNQSKVQVKSVLIGPDAQPLGRITAKTSEALADGASLAVATGAGPAVMAQGWLYDGQTKVWVAANTGASTVGGCTDCGTGKDGDYLADTNKSMVGGTYEFKSFSIKPGVTVTVTGSAPLVLKVQGLVQIDGLLDLRGGDAPDVSTCCPDAPGGAAGGGGGYAGAIGPGVSGTANGNGPGAGVGGCAAGYGAGGGGAGHAGVGAAGTTSPASCSPGGTGGPAYGSSKMTAGLEPGSGGASGGYGSAANSAGGGGGGGGGAVQIIASKIAVSTTGSIRVDGGHGGNVIADRDGGGGGGGSGGAIWLRGSLVTIAGPVSAMGGAGGKSDKLNSYGGDGGDGSAGRIIIDSPAPVQGSTNPSYESVGTTGLDIAGANKFAMQTDGAGTVTLINQSGAAQKVMLVVTY